MLTSELIETLRSEGIRTSAGVLRYGVEQGYIPRPKLDRSLRMVWAEAEIEAARRYARSPRKSGPKPKRKPVEA